MKKINWKQLLIPPMLFIIILLLSGCGEDTPRQICLDTGGDWNALSTGCTYPEENTFYTSAEVDEMLQEHIDIMNILNDNINRLSIKLTNLQNEYDIMFDIVNEVEYNTVESQCETDDYYICYNNSFYYHIDSNDKVVLLFGEYNVIAIQIVLERQEDGDFYYTMIGMYDDSFNGFFKESYEIYITTNYGSSAVTLIQHIIESEDWTLFDSLEDWEDFKIQLEIDDTEW